MKPFPVAFASSLPEAGGETKVTFDAIYDKNYWQSVESGSGSGSEIARTEGYRPKLVAAIRDLGIKSIFDAPCGDLNWMPLVLAQVDVSYIGGDIADAALATARAKHPNLDVRLFDICTDRFPTADLWHCRDTLFHLSFADIFRSLERLAASDIKFAAITTHKARMLKNLDIVTGGFRLVDLERAPFNFPRADRYLADDAPGEFPRSVGIWSVDQIRRALDARSEVTSA